LITILSCSRCKQDKPIEAFRRRRNRPETGTRFGRWSWCRQCEIDSFKTPKRRAQASVRQKVFRDNLRTNNLAEMRRREREQNLRSKYGFGEEEYNAMLHTHGGLCAICGKPPTTGRGKKLHVDHDHDSGVIRGLLCSVCNVSLGGFKDDPALLRRAAEYVESFVTQPAS
jgi:hypothetical protein